MNHEDWDAEIQAYLDGVASAEQIERLNRALATRADVQAAFIAAAKFDFLLECHWEEHRDHKQADEVMRLLRLEGLDSIAPMKLPASTRLRWPAAMAAGLKEVGREFSQQPAALAILLLVVLCGAVLYWQLSQFSPRPVAQQPAPHVGLQPNVVQQTDEPVRSDSQPPFTPPTQRPIAAKLVRTVGATWDQVVPLTDGTELKAGHKLKLEFGLVEIAFASGATVILEGPAEFEVGRDKADRRSGAPVKAESACNACSLTLGKLVAHVPQQALGFTVATPTWTIVDQGTQFGVSVQRLSEFEHAGLHSASTSTEVHVFLGKVAVNQHLSRRPAADPVAANQTLATVLQAGEGLASEPDGLPPRAIKADPASYVRTWPDSSLPSSADDHVLQAGDIVAVTTKSMQLIKIDPKSGEQQVLAQGSPFHGPGLNHGVAWHCVALAKDRSVLVGVDGLDGKDAGVLRIDPRTAKIDVLARGGLLGAGQVSGLAVAADGRIYGVYQAAIHAQPEYVIEIDGSNGTVKPLARVEQAFAISVDARGHALISSPEAQRLSYWDGNSIASLAEGDRVGRPRGVAIRSDGRSFLVARFGNGHKILEIDQDRVRTIANLPTESDVEAPDSMAVEPDGNLILASPRDDSARIYRVDVRSGKVAVVASAGHLLQVSGVAVVPLAHRDSGAAPQR